MCFASWKALERTPFTNNPTFRIFFQGFRCQISHVTGSDPHKCLESPRFTSHIPHHICVNCFQKYHIRDTIEVHAELFTEKPFHFWFWSPFTCFNIIQKNIQIIPNQSSHCAPNIPNVSNLPKSSPWSLVIHQCYKGQSTYFKDFQRINTYRYSINIPQIAIRIISVNYII